MNRFTFLAATAAVGALGFLGCDDKRDANVPSTMPPNASDMMKQGASTQQSGAPSSATRPAGGDAIDDAANEVNDAADKAGDALNDAGKSADDALDDAAGKADDAGK